MDLLLKYIDKLTVIVLLVIIVIAFFKRKIHTDEEFNELKKRCDEETLQKEYFQELAQRYAAMTDKLIKVVEYYERPRKEYLRGQKDSTGTGRDSIQSGTQDK